MAELHIKTQEDYEELIEILRNSKFPNDMTQKKIDEYQKEVAFLKNNAKRNVFQKLFGRREKK